MKAIQSLRNGCSACSLWLWPKGSLRQRIAGMRKPDAVPGLWPAEDVHQLTLALLDGEYATVTTTDEILASL